MDVFGEATFKMMMGMLWKSVREDLGFRLVRHKHAQWAVPHPLHGPDDDIEARFERSA